MSPLFSWGAGGGLGFSVAAGTSPLSGDKKQQTVVPMGGSGGSFIVAVGLGGMQSLEQIWA